MGALMSWRLRGLLASFPGQQNGGLHRVTDIAQLVHPSGVPLPPQVAAMLHQAMADSLRLARNAEYTDLTFIDGEASLAGYLREHRQEFSPPGLACLLTAGRQRYGDHWYERASL